MNFFFSIFFSTRNSNCCFVVSQTKLEAHNQQVRYSATTKALGFERRDVSEVVESKLEPYFFPPVFTAAARVSSLEIGVFFYIGCETRPCLKRSKSSKSKVLNLIGIYVFLLIALVGTEGCIITEYEAIEL